ncbi:MAG: hypothetical protein IT371_19270 [Deltaproteobacteria bacterium]|nr:hypothetical protein [Deltaproteobacteria bacterium]
MRLPRTTLLATITVFLASTGCGNGGSSSPTDGAGASCQPPTCDACLEIDARTVRCPELRDAENNFINVIICRSTKVSPDCKNTCAPQIVNTACASVGSFFKQCRPDGRGGYACGDPAGLTEGQRAIHTCLSTHCRGVGG